MRCSRRRRAPALLFCLAASAAIHAQSLTSLQADFVRTTRTGPSTETVKGTLYYRPSAGVILRVREPVSQWVVFETGGMLIWYSETGKAFRFTEKSPSPYGFASTFVGVPKPDFGLAAAGFTLAGSESRDGELHTRWKPPAGLARTIGTATVGSRSNSPYLLEIADPGGKLLARVAYTSFVTYGPLSIPSRIEVVQMAQGVMVTVEVLYSGHVFNGRLPAEVLDFRLPAGVKVEEMEL